MAPYGPNMTPGVAEYHHYSGVILGRYKSFVFNGAFFLVFRLISLAFGTGVCYTYFSEWNRANEAEVGC